MSKKYSDAVKAAFPETIPVLTGYLFLGMAYGIMMKSSGFPAIYPTAMSLLVYGGSLQFASVALLLSPFAPVQALILALVVQMRHLFYGISMLKPYSEYHGIEKFLMVYGLTDETFSINCGIHAPDGVDKKAFMMSVNLIDWFYWTASTALGALVGSVIPFDMTGIDFAMTALFVVIFINQWTKEKSHTSSLLGLGATFICLKIFGTDSFLIPSMIAITAVLAALRKRGAAE